MQHSLTFGALAACLASSLALAQTVVIPGANTTVPGTAANVFPYGSISTAFPGLRIQFVYDSSEFTGQSLGSPIAITGIKMRAFPTSASWTGGTYATSTVSMSTAAVDYLATTTNYATNHGLDLTAVYSGPVVVQPGTGNGTGVPGPWHIDIQLATPFIYDPTTGDLAIEFDNPSPSTNWTGGSLTAIDHTIGSACRRVYGSSLYPNANGVDNYTAVLELAYGPAGSNYATKTNFGAGCNPPAARATFYESNPAFDMSNTSLTMINLGNGYLVQPGSATWHTPTSTPIVIGDDQVVGFPLGWTLPYPGSSTTNLTVSSNGFVNANTHTLNGCCAFNLTQFLANGPCWSALWRDLNPAAGGTVTLDTDTVNGDAWVTFDQVVNYGTSLPNTFQFQFHQSGIVDIVWQSCQATAAGVGWSPGAASMDPGSIDLSALVVLITSPDSVPLRLAGDVRPVTGTTVNLTISSVPTGSIAGGLILSFVGHNPGIDLTPFGMPGCRQYADFTAVQLLLAPASSVTRPFAIPNDPTLAGIHVFCQGAAYDPAGGHNQLGALSSNGVDLGINVN